MTVAAPVLVPSLRTLRAEFDLLSASRDKASDGWIADGAHVAAGTSDHIGDEQAVALRNRDADSTNEVHAIDVDVDLRKPDWTMERCVQLIVLRQRTLIDQRLQYVIYNRRIFSRSWNWTARAYNGPNPHDHHAHFSARYDSAQEADTRPWGLVEAARASTATTMVATGKASGPAPGSRLLKQGMTGPDVGFLQRWTGAKDTGVFDAATKARVIRYQKIVGVAADGIAGKVTWSRILGRKVTFK